MRILVDTSVWSLALRRRSTYPTQTVNQLQKFIEDGERIFLLGLILQELLSGITDRKLFKRLADYLSAFPIIDLQRDDYVQAAALRNQCKTRGVQAGTVDFLIASTCITRNLLLFSVDNDFQEIAKASSLKLIGGS